MIDSLIRWSLAHRIPVLLVATVFCAYGIYTSLRLPVDVFPDLTAPTVTILAEGHGMAPEDMELQVTLPVEAALNGATGVRRVRSSTTAGFSLIWAEFQWGQDPLDARRIVDEKLSTISSDLPAGITPVLAPISSIMGEVMFLGVWSHSGDELGARTFAEVHLRRRLLSIEGVSQVSVMGGKLKQFQIQLDPRKLLAYRVSTDAVIEAVRGDNQNVTAGWVEEAGSEYIVAGRGRFHSLEDIGDVVVRAEELAPLLVRHLGTVAIGSAPRRGVGSVRGVSSVILAVKKQPTANTIELTRRIEDVLDDVERSLPADLVLEREIFRQSDFIETAIRNVLHALRDGGILVVLIMLLFLANVRATVITLTAIPLSLVAAIFTLQALGATINTMTLGGMAIAIGALVDDAVIDVENVIRRLRENVARPEAERRPSRIVIFEASKEIRNSIAFATLIVMLVFLPVFFLPGIEGRLLRPLGTAYVVSLFASLVVALTVTPALCSVLLPRSRNIREPDEARIARSLKRVYGRFLHSWLDRPLGVTLPVLMLLVLSIFLVFRQGRAFLPDFNEGALTINATTVPGIHLDQSDELGRIVEEKVLSVAGVVSTARRTGRAELDEHTQGVNVSEIEATLDLENRSRDELLEELREKLSMVPGMSITIGQPISHRIDHMLSGTRASLAVKIFGPDLHELRRLAERVRRSMEVVPGIVDLAVEQQTDIPLLLARFDRASLARHGVRVSEASTTLKAAVEGVEVSHVIDQASRFAVVVRLGSGSRPGPEVLEKLRVDSALGVSVPFSALASLRKDRGPNTISREDVQRKIVVSANVAGRDITSVVRELEEPVREIVARQPGYRVEFGGQFESAEAASRLILILGFGVVLGIGFLLHLAFGSVRDALFVMSNLPLALIGGVAGVILGGGVLSVASLIGFITVFGIATRNGIMLISHIRHLEREEGVKDFRQAVHRGAVERLLPILMTALGTALALVPIVLGGDRPGNEIQMPMAAVILCGIVTATILNMVIVPTLFLRFSRPLEAPEAGSS